MVILVRHHVAERRMTRSGVEDTVVICSKFTVLYSVFILHGQSLKNTI